MQKYRCKDGDMLDAICFKYYGSQIGTAEAVLEANPGLAEHGPMLPAGLVIELPDIDAPQAEKAVRLWD